MLKQTGLRIEFSQLGTEEKNIKSHDENFLVDLGPEEKPSRFYCMITQSSYLCSNSSLFSRFLPSHFHLQFTEIGCLKLQVITSVILQNNLKM